MLTAVDDLTKLLSYWACSTGFTAVSKFKPASPGRSSTPNVEGLPDLADLPDLVIPDVDSCTGNDTVLYTIYWRNCTVAILSDVFNNLEILSTPLILVIMLLQDNNIFKKLTSGIMDSLTGFQDNLVQSWWPDFPTGVAGHVGGTSVSVTGTRGSGTAAFQQGCCYFIRLVYWVTSVPSHSPVHGDGGCVHLAY